MPDGQELSKQNAAVAGASFVMPDMVVGLGSGSTAELLVKELGRRVLEEGLKIVAVSTSERTSQLAISVGIKVVEPADVAGLDLVIDGADEVDPAFRMIKGRGGALLREKIVAAAGQRRIILVDQSKPVAQLGLRHKLPVEIAEFGMNWTLASLRKIMPYIEMRKTAQGELYRTDGGNHIADLSTGLIANPEALQASLLMIPGVYETGLFIGLCDVLVVASETGVEILDRTTANWP